MQHEGPLLLLLLLVASAASAAAFSGARGERSGGQSIKPFLLCLRRNYGRVSMDIVATTTTLMSPNSNRLLVSSQSASDCAYLLPVTSLSSPSSILQNFSDLRHRAKFGGTLDPYYFFYPSMLSKRSGTQDAVEGNEERGRLLYRRCVGNVFHHT